MVTKKDIDAQCASFSSSTLVHVVENGTKTNNIVCNMSTAINSLAHLIGIGNVCRAPIPRTFMYAIRKIMLIDENYKKLFLIFRRNYNTRLFFKCWNTIICGKLLRSMMIDEDP
jgi:hypothetical protein